jgi:hypothetical protein
MPFKASKSFDQHVESVQHKNMALNLPLIMIDQPMTSQNDDIVRPIATHATKSMVRWKKPTRRIPVSLSSSPSSSVVHGKETSVLSMSVTRVCSDQRPPKSTTVNDIESTSATKVLGGNVNTDDIEKEYSVATKVRHKTHYPQHHIPLKKRRIRTNRTNIPIEFSCSTTSEASPDEKIQGDDVSSAQDVRDNYCAKSAYSVQVDETSLRRLVASCWKYYPHSTSLLPKGYYKEEFQSLTDQHGSGNAHAEGKDFAAEHISTNSSLTSFSPNWLKITTLPPTSGPYHYQDDQDDMVTDQDPQRKLGMQFMLAADINNSVDSDEDTSVSRSIKVRSKQTKMVNTVRSEANAGFDKVHGNVKNITSKKRRVEKKAVSFQSHQLLDGNSTYSSQANEKAKTTRVALVTHLCTHNNNEPLNHDEEDESQDSEIGMFAAMSEALAEPFQTNECMSHKNTVTPSPIPFHHFEEYEVDSADSVPVSSYK